MAFHHARLSALVAGSILLAGSVSTPLMAQSENPLTLPQEEVRPDSPPPTQPETPSAPPQEQVSPSSQPSTAPAEAPTPIVTPPAESPTPIVTPPAETTPATSQPEVNSESVDQDDPELQKLIEEGQADEPEAIPEASPETSEIRGQRTPAGVSNAPGRFRAMRQATTKLGYTEGAGNSNVFSAYFGRPNVAWCAAFVSWAFDARPVGNHNKRLPWANPLRVVSILEWGRKNNQIVKQPQPGDLFIMQARGASHIGFVRAVKGSVFSTVEGNTTKPGNRRVEGVFSHNRDMRKFPFIFVRVPARTGT